MLGDGKDGLAAELRIGGAAKGAERREAIAVAPVGSELAGEAAEGLLCSQAGIPAEAADRQFLDGYKKKFNIEPIL